MALIHNPRGRNLRWSKFALVGAALAVTLAACGEDGAKGLPGKWTVAEVSGPSTKAFKGFDYTFTADGKVSVGVLKCTYVHEAPKLTFTCSGVDQRWNAELKDGDQTLVLSNKTKQVLTLKRK